MHSSRAIGTLTDDGDGSGSIRFEPRVGDAGFYLTSVIVTDDGVPRESDSQSFTLTVAEKPVDPALVVPVVIIPTLLD